MRSLTSRLKHCDQIQPRRFLRQDLIDPGTNGLLTKTGDIDGMSLALIHKFLVVSIPQGLRRARLRAPGFEVLAGAIITEIALLHQASLHVKLGYSKGTGIHTIATTNTTRWLRLLHNPLRCNENSHNRTELRARSQRVLTVHTNGWLCGYTDLAVHKIHHHHAFTLV